MKISDQWKIFIEARKSAPVDVFSLPAKLGVRLREAFLADDISGMLERDQDTFLITLSANDSVTRKRFTLAHELGHYMLHRNLVGDGVDDDRAYRSTQAGKYHNTLIGPHEETQANKFAASLLMPDALINAEWAKAQGDVGHMAKLFGVSKHAMSIRVGVTYTQG